MRNGIACGGNWVLDRIKMCDEFPRSGMLTIVHSEELRPGGAPPNILADLAKMQTKIPLSGFGLLGEDEEGRFLRDYLRNLNITISDVQTDKKNHTSTTDVFTKKTTGERIFFHFKGTNAHFGPEHIPIGKINSKIFHLAYLLILDRFDAPDPAFGTVAARFLSDLQKEGIETSIDLVSEESDRFSSVVPSVLPFADYIIINEVEASKITGIEIRKKDESIDRISLFESIKKMNRLAPESLIAIHMPEGAAVLEKNGTYSTFGSPILPKGFIVSAVGAGDAFCAGMLLGLHEQWALAKCVQLGMAAATASLSQSGASDGITNITEMLANYSRFSLRPAL